MSTKTKTGKNTVAHLDSYCKKSQALTLTLAQNCSNTTPGEQVSTQQVRIESPFVKVVMCSTPTNFPIAIFFFLSAG